MLRRTLVLCLTVALLPLTACERDTAGLAPARPFTDPVVFSDDFGSGVTFEAFLGSKLDAIEVVEDEKTEGAASLAIKIPRAGDAGGGFAGGAMPTGLARNLTGYNALTFWAAAEVPTTFDVVGLGNDNTGTSKFGAERSGLALTPAWQRFVVPIPLPSRLVAERGMFHFADGTEDGSSITVWFDDIRFDTDPTIRNPRGAMQPRTVGTFVGATVEMQNTSTTFAISGIDETINHQPDYFDFQSSDPGVVAIVDNQVKVVGQGTAQVTATLGGAPVTGAVTVNAQGAPEMPAPTPTHPSSNVISMFSDAYTNHPIDTWRTDWSQGSALTDFQVQGDNVKAYTNLIFAGIEFINPTINASAMTHFHFDVWVSATSNLFKIKFVDFGADGMFGGSGDNADSEREVSFSIAGNPPLVREGWASFDIELDSLMGAGGLRSRANLAQLVVSGTNNTVFIDNLYYFR